MLFSSRLGVLATPDAVVSRPVPQLSIPINGNFEIVRGTCPFLFIFVTVLTAPGMLSIKCLRYLKMPVATDCSLFLFLCSLFVIPCQHAQPVALDCGFFKSYT